MLPNRRHLWAVALACATLALAGPEPTSACSCADTSPAQAIAQAELVAEVEAGPAESVSSDIEYQAADTHMLLIRVFRGQASEGRELVVRAGTEPTACGVRFERGQRYLLFASRMEDGTWRTDSCSHTRPIERAGPELEILASSP